MLAASIGERNRSAVRVGDWICSSGLKGRRVSLDVPSFVCECSGGASRLWAKLFL